MEKHNSNYTYCPMPMGPLPWEFVAKNTCFRNLYVLWMNVCKKCHFPLSELSLPLRGCKRLAGVKKAWWNKFDICWIWTSLLPGCQGGGGDTTRDRLWDYFAVHSLILSHLHIHLGVAAFIRVGPYNLSFNFPHTYQRYIYGCLLCLPYFIFNFF